MDMAFNFLYSRYKYVRVLVNAKVGAVTYNIFHHKGIAIACVGLGFFLKIEVMLAIGILLFAHSSFDRIMGYGLKYYSSFNDTHLGRLKKVKTIDNGQSELDII